MGKEDALARSLVAKANTQEEIRDVCKRTLQEVKSLPQEKKEKAEGEEEEGSRMMGMDRNK